MFEITIYLKNGSKFSIFSDKFTVQRTIGGAFAGLEWVSGNKEQERLMYVDMNDISAITSRPTLFAPDKSGDSVAASVLSQSEHLPAQEGEQ
jgi:hypothetical protein